jgi:heme-degrading monooxygenase HmoA
MQLKPGAEHQMAEQLREFEAAQVPGFVSLYVYRMDADPNVYYVAVAFENKEAYVANAQSPEQHARYEKMLALQVGEPEWNDGEIVAAVRGRS